MRKTHDTLKAKAFQEKKPAKWFNKGNKPESREKCGYCDGKHPKAKEKFSAFRRRCKACRGNNNFALCC